MTTSGPLLTRIGNVDALSWNPVRTAEGEAGARLVDNFGDLIGPLLVERIAGERAVDRMATETSDVSVLLSVGSIVHFAPPSAVIWGSGVNFKLAKKVPAWAESLDVRALRGPHSARAMAAAGVVVPDVFGDPALLLPQFMPEMVAWRDEGRGGIVVVPNLNDYGALGASAPNDARLLNPRRSLTSLLRRIAGSDMVVGSSLHAVVIADALGIPARFVASPTEGMWKYRDYLAGTGRPFTRIAADVDDAIALGGHSRPEVDLERLLHAFPFDLWGLPAKRRPASTFTERDSILAAWSEMLPRPLFDVVPLEQRFVTEILPSLVEAVEKEQVESSTEPAEATGPRSAQYLFDDARAYRQAFTAGVDSGSMGEDAARLVASIDANRLDRLVRGLWLDHQGPHALLRSALWRNDRLIVSIALRVGESSNRLRWVEVSAACARGETVSVQPPVFAMYHRQWTIDLNVALPVGSAEPTSIVVRFMEEDREPESLVVLDGGAESVSLQAFPEVRELPQWRGLSEKEPALMLEGKDAV